MTDSRPRSILLLSGGLDSTVAAFIAAESTEIVMAIGFDYGQRAVRRELAAGYAVARRVGAVHRTVFLPFFRDLVAGGSLLAGGAALPTPTVADLDDPEAARRSAAAVWVPNRNGVFIAIAAAFAEAARADVLVVGFNAEEAQTFPDNGAEFVARQNEALRFSTANGVRVWAPTQDWTKVEIVRKAHQNDWPLELVWSCYDGDDRPCGRCESCCRLDRAVVAAGAEDWLERRRKEAKK